MSVTSASSESPSSEARLRAPGRLADSATTLEWAMGLSQAGVILFSQP